MSALIDTEQIAKILGVSRPYVTDRLTKLPDFPKPRVNSSQRLRKWSEAEVLAWAAQPRKKAA